MYLNSLSHSYLAIQSDHSLENFHDAMPETVQAAWPPTMEACRPLSDYAWFIAEVRRCNETMGIKAAVDKALDNMPEESVIKKFLIANKAEVEQMCITEYDEVEAMKQFKAEGHAEGHAEGLADGDLLRLIKIIYKKMIKGKTNEEIADAVEEDIILIEQVRKAILDYKRDCTCEKFDANNVLAYYKRK